MEEGGKRLAAPVTKKFYRVVAHILVHIIVHIFYLTPSLASRKSGRLSHTINEGMPLGLYISVPFCRTKKSFFNFASGVFSESAYENYVARLIEDIASSRRLAGQFDCKLEENTDSIGDPIVDSIYLGGGTPSILGPGQLRRIFAAARDHFAIM